MKRARLAFALVTVTASLGSAQTKPNFSGTWVQMTPADGAGSEIVVKHDAATLVQQHDSEGGGHVLKYMLDGAEHRNEPMAMGDGQITGRHKATWDDARLVIDESNEYPNGGHRTAHIVWWINDKGQLVIEGKISGVGERLDFTSTYRRK